MISSASSGFDPSGFSKQSIVGPGGHSGPPSVVTLSITSKMRFQNRNPTSQTNPKNHLTSIGGESKRTPTQINSRGGIERASAVGREADAYSIGRDVRSS